VRVRLAASILFVLAASAFLFISFTPFAISRRLRHQSNQAIVHAQIQISRWRGRPPRLVAIAGQVDQPGAQVQALDSRSGWAAMSDREGRFVLPDVLWYPGASYDILVSTDYEHGKVARVSTSSTPPEDGLIQAGRIVPAGDSIALASEPGVNSYSRERYDSRNRDYYVDLYHKLTDGKQSDEQKVEAVNEFVGTRLNYLQTGKELVSARRVIEQGSQWCGHLAVAMATIIVTGYPARIVHLMDASGHPNTHALVEVDYGGDWHLYDPTFGVRFLDESGRVASYRSLRLNPALVLDSAYDNYRRQYPAADSVAWMPEMYRSGYHHFFLIEFK
jgi:hypothetical protein